MIANETTKTFIGIDVASKKFDVAVNISGKLSHAVFENTKKGFKELTCLIKSYKLDLSNCWACMESTGHYGRDLADYLYDHKLTVSTINPLMIKSFGKVVGCRNKNDKIDAQLILDYSEKMTENLRHYKPNASAIGEIRDYLKYREALRKHKIKLMQQSQSAVCDVIKKSYQEEIIETKKKMDELQYSAESIAKNNDFLAEKNVLLQSIPGVGPITALTYLAFVPDIDDFDSAAQLAAFTGVSPTQNKSGEFIGRSKMSKKGCARARTALYSAALQAKRSLVFEEFVNRHTLPGRAPKFIVGIMMVKLTKIIFGVLKSGKAFDPEKVKAKTH